MDNNETNKDLEVLKLSFLGEKFLDKLNPNKVSKLFNNKFKTIYTYGSFQTMIRKEYHVAWDTKEKKYFSTDHVNGIIHLENQNFNKNYIHMINLLHADEIKARNSVNLTTEEKEYSKRKDETVQTDLDTILNHLQTLNKEIGFLRAKLNKIENYFKDNSPQKRKELTEEFVKIFSSNSKRESVNINAEIKRRIISKMAEQKNISNNQSASINTALLIALFNDG